MYSNAKRNNITNTCRSHGSSSRRAELKLTFTEVTLVTIGTIASELLVAVVGAVTAVETRKRCARVVLNCDNTRDENSSHY